MGILQSGLLMSISTLLESDEVLERPLPLCVSQWVPGTPVPTGSCTRMHVCGHSAASGGTAEPPEPLAVLL